MGQNESSPNPDQQTKIRTSNSYYGSNNELGDLNNQNIETTIRDLQLERLYQHNPQLRPRPKTPEPSQVHAKTFLSISDPSPFIKKVGNILEICFGLKAQAPGRIVVIANNLINTASFQSSEDRKLIIIPLPQNTDFVVELSPDISQSTEKIPHGYVPIEKHVLSFSVKSEDQIVFEETKLFTPTQNYKVKSGNTIPIIEEDKANDLVCLICFNNQADFACASCGHKIVCTKCQNEKNPRFCHCPICDCPSSL